MVNNRQIIRNAGWLAASEGVATVLLSIVGFLLLMTWGSSQLGKLGVVTSYVAMIAFIFDFGLPSIVTQRLAKNPSETSELIGNALTLKIITTTIGFSILACALVVDGHMRNQWGLIAIWSVGVAASAFTSFWYSIIRAYEEMFFEAVGKIINAVLQVVIVLSIVLSRGEVPMYIYLVSGMIVAHAMGIGIYVARRYGSSLHLRYDYKYIRRLSAHALPLVFSSVFATLYFSIDSLMLDRWFGETVVGEYTAGYRFVFLLLAFLNLGYSVLFPTISRLFDTDLSRLAALLSNAVRLMCTLVLPFVIAISLQSAQVLGLLNQSYIPGAAALAVLIWTVAANSISMACSFPLIARGDRMQYMYGLALGALMNIAMNIVLIPILHAQGAAIATLAADTVLILYYWKLVRARVPEFRLVPHVFPAIAAGGCMMTVIVGLQQFHVHVIVTSVIAWVIYMGCAFLFRGILHDDIRMIASAFRRKSVVEI